MADTERLLVKATYLTEVYTVVEVPTGTEHADVQSAARQIDGACFTERESGLFDGDWQIESVRPLEADDPEQEACAYDLTKELK